MKGKKYTLTLNTKEKLFFIGSAAGFTCLGFDVCLERSIAMANWIGNIPVPDKSFWGTMKGYEQYQTLVETCRMRYEKTGEKCPCELIPQLNGLEGKRVEVVDKWDERRRFKVGKSAGWIPIHIELARSNSSGGPAVSGAPFKSVRVL